jgi:hypothetical protein
MALRQFLGRLQHVILNVQRRSHTPEAIGSLHHGQRLFSRETGGQSEKWAGVVRLGAAFGGVPIRGPEDGRNGLLGADLRSNSLRHRRLHPVVLVRQRRAQRRHPCPLKACNQFKPSDLCNRCDSFDALGPGRGSPREVSVRWACSKPGNSQVIGIIIQEVYRGNTRGIQGVSQLVGNRKPIASHSKAISNPPRPVWEQTTGSCHPARHQSHSSLSGALKRGYLVGWTR